MTIIDQLIATVMIQKMDTKTVDAAVGYQDPQSEQKFILMINQAIFINTLENHLLCPMQCHLNGVQDTEVPKFLAESHSETTHAIDVANPFDAAHLSVKWCDQLF